MRNEAGKDVNGDCNSAVNGTKDDGGVKTDESLKLDNSATKDGDDLVRGASHGCNRRVRRSNKRCTER